VIRPEFTYQNQSAYAGNQPTDFLSIRYFVLFMLILIAALRVFFLLLAYTKARAAKTDPRLFFNLDQGPVTSQTFHFLVVVS
jgi:hypothetical protein